MKRLITLLLAFLFILSCGCTRTEEQLQEPESAVQEPEPEIRPDEDIGKLCISEFMPKNHCTLTDGDGIFSDWIELENKSDGELSTEGWSLSDGEESVPWMIGAQILAPGEKLLIFASGKDRNTGEQHTDFSLSGSEELCLYTPSGSLAQSFPCRDIPADCSAVLKDTDMSISIYPTPGYNNDTEGWDSFQSNALRESPLLINEVMTANKWDAFEGSVMNNDWVEIKNVSENRINLADYYLSDDMDEPYMWQLPDKELSPGSRYVIICSDEGPFGYPQTNFRLNSGEDRLYLSDAGGLRDWALLRGIPAGCSYGRQKGENGFFFINEPSPGGGNKAGERRVSETPVSLTRDGVYENTESLSVELQGEGTIYYTLDGSLPGESSNVYEGPIELNKTGVIRAVAVQSGALNSRPLNLSFIMNEGHSLPVVSLCADNPKLFEHYYKTGNKAHECPGSISFYEEDGGFSMGCGLNLSGQTSLRLPKKNLKVMFRGVYGEEELNYDLFGEGEMNFGSLSLRSGQDSHRIIFRQEIWQDLCMDMGDSVPNQHSRFCIVYINGEYYGIHCIKENMNREWYADINDVSKDSVQKAVIPELVNEDFIKEVFNYCRENDMSLKEHYEHICAVLDMDSFIDWVIIEGVSNNLDLFRNVRFYKSPESGGKWQAALFDLDHSLVNDGYDVFILGEYENARYNHFGTLFGDGGLSSHHLTKMLKNFMKNEEFRQSLISRYAQVYNTVLSNERILERVDYYSALLSPEVERDWLRWGKNPEDWFKYVEHVRATITYHDWENKAKESFCRYMMMSEEEIAEYFGQ